MMPVNAIFLHIQKTGGTSLQEMARSVYGNDQVISHADFQGMTSESIEKKKFISGHFRMDFALQYREGRVLFTILRDPVDRVISLYNYYQLPKANSRNAQIAKSRTFEEFLVNAISDTKLKWAVNNHFVKSLSGVSDFKDLIRGGDLKPLAEKSIENLSLLDYVGTVENYNEDYRAITKLLQWPEIGSLTHNNKSPKKITRALLNKTEIELLAYHTRYDTMIYERVAPSLISRP